MNIEIAAAKDLDPASLANIAKVIGEAETTELLISLLAGLEDGLRQMDEALRAGELRALSRMAHKHAGGCGSLGALALQDRLRRIERVASQGLGPESEAEIAVLPVLMARLRTATETYLRTAAMAG